MRDIDRYREQRKESRCGLWAETAESPRLLSLLYRIVNLEQTQSACCDKRQRTTAKREDTEEKPTKERRADKQERA